MLGFLAGDVHGVRSYVMSMREGELWCSLGGQGCPCLPLVCTRSVNPQPRACACCSGRSGAKRGLRAQEVVAGGWRDHPGKRARHRSYGDHGENHREQRLQPASCGVGAHQHLGTTGNCRKGNQAGGPSLLVVSREQLVTCAEERRAHPAGGVGDRVPVAGGRPADAAQGAPRPEAALRHGRGAAHVRRRGRARCGQRLTSTLGVGACAQRAVLPDATTPKCA